jgi:hypothetical protein
MPRPQRRTELSADYIRSILAYDPLTGEFRWRHRDDRPKWWNTHYAGKIAGTIDANGYRRICIDNGCRHLGQRLAWLIMTALWPINEIDHKNTDNGDNRWDNLREATEAQNKRNRRMLVRNASGLKGVCAHKGKWQATIYAEGINYYLGRFDTPKAAHNAYCAAAKQLHGEFARTA